MTKYLILGRYSPEAVRGIAARRTKKFGEIVKKEGGRIIAMYALVGRYDLAFLVEMPTNAALIKAVIAITKLTGIGFTSLPAMTIEEFDKIAG